MTGRPGPHLEGEGQVSGKVTGRRGRKWEERRGDIRRVKERAARKGGRTGEKSLKKHKKGA